jgi:ComF family protein
MINKILDIIFPKSCLECGKQGEGYICSSCFLVFKETLKVEKIYNNFYDTLIYIDKYDAKTREQILNMKFSTKPYIAEYFTEILVKHEKIKSYLKNFDMIIPVPMQKLKKSERGYNQTEIFGKALALKIDVPCNIDILQKVKENKTQSTLNYKDRQKNVKDIFKVDLKRNIKGKNIILVDDIFTTGATVKECSKILKLSGVSKICVIVIAKDFKKN